MTDSPSAIQQQVNDALKAAMRAKEKDNVAALRQITAAFKQKEIDERISLTDADVLAILDKLAKQRRESIEQYQAAGRDDLVAKEQFELAIIQGFLPQALSEAEIDDLIEAAITSTGASGMQDMGKVMAEVKPKVQGRADMGAVSARVKGRLGQ